LSVVFGKMGGTAKRERTAGVGDDDILWENPESTATGSCSSAWVDRLSPLMENPGCWANLGDYTNATVTLLKQGKLRTPPGRWEFTGRRRDLPKGRAHLFARYLGPEEA
jgi:hypothetical protein